MSSTRIIPDIHPQVNNIPPQWQDFEQHPPYDPNTTLAAHFQSIPGDVLWNFNRALSDGNLRHEGTMYGYYNRFLNAAFPSNRWYQVSHPYASNVRFGTDVDI